MIRFQISTPWAVVGSYSMVPVLDIGDIVILKKPSITQLQVGTVIVYVKKFKSRVMEIVHRIYRKYVIDHIVEVQTKGDANPIPDPWYVTLREIRGIVILVIPHIGLIGLILRDLALHGEVRLLLPVLLGLFYLIITYMTCKIVEER